MAALEIHQPDLLELARREPTKPFDVTPDLDGQLNLFDHDTHQKWYETSVSTALETLHAREDIQRRRLVVFLGCGLGHEINAALSMQRNRTLLIIEPEPDIFRWAIRTTDLTQAIQHPNTEFMVGLSLGELRLQCSKSFAHPRYLFYIKSIARVVPHGAAHRYPDYVIAASDIVIEVLKKTFDLCGNDIEDNLIGLGNICNNLPVLAKNPDIWGLKNLLRGQPAIIASAGPSLQKSLPTLKKLAHKIPIFCPDTSIRLLQNAGITPHVAASRERLEMTIRHFENLEDTTNTLLACCPALQPRIFELYKGPLAFIYRSGDYYTWLKPENEPYNFEGSAGNLALNLAAFAGCNPLILVGQDLCFDTDGRTHAKGTSTGSFNAYYKKLKTVEAPGNRGDIVLTTERWLTFRHQFETAIPTYSAKVYNATARGVDIPGAETVELDDIVSRLELGSDPRQVILDKFKTKSLKKQTEREKAFSTFVNEARDDAQKMRETLIIAKKFVAISNKRFKPPKTKKICLDALLREDPYKTIGGIRQEAIAAGGDTFRQFLSILIQPLMLSIESNRYDRERLGSTSKELAQNFIELYTKWYNAVDETLRRAIDLLEIGQKSLAASTLCESRPPICTSEDTADISVDAAPAPDAQPISPSVHGA